MIEGLENKVYQEGTGTSQKEQIGKILFNEKQPSMITFVNGKEIHKLSVLKVLVAQENKLRKQLGIQEPNILHEVIIEQLVLRTSINGTRAEQGVKIISNILDEQNRLNSDFGNKINRILKGG